MWWLQEHEQETEGEKEDYRVSVIETSTGKKLTGDEAPLKSELEQWLQDHPKSVHKHPPPRIVQSESPEIDITSMHVIIYIITSSILVLIIVWVRVRMQI